MDSIFFWQNRRADTKYPYLVLLLVAVLAFGLGLYHYFTAENSMIRWEKVPHLQPVDAFINQFKLAGQTFSIKANGYLLTERYDASLPFINLNAAKIFLGLLAICLAFYVTAVSTLRRFPYLAGMFLLMFFLVSCNLDALGLFSATGKYALVAVLLLLSLPSYAFQAFFPEVSFTKRLLVFSLLLFIIGLLIFKFSALPAEVTAMHIVNHASIGCVVASILFILWVSIEIIHGMLWLNTRAKTQAGRFGMWQFMLISLLYIGNLLLFYLEEAGIYQFGFVYLDAFIILFLSAVAAFWGLQKRAEIYGQVAVFWPGAAFLFLVFATITFLSIGYIFATANDPLIAAYNSLIIYTHLAYGVMFFLYVMINFGRLIAQKLPVYRVVYDPKKLPFYPVYIMGTILLAVLLLRTNVNAYKQVKAGYYNYLGDLYKTSGEEILAERFYIESDVFEHSNVKANYSLAGLCRERNFRNREIVYLKEALLLRPNPKIFARLSAEFDEQRYFFEQQYTLKRALSKFPENPETLTNMGLLYNKTTLADSVLYYYDLAEKFSKEKPVIQSNKLALFIKTGLPKQAETLASQTTGTDYLPLQSNKILLEHLTGKQSKPIAFPAANANLTIPEFSALYHTILNRLHAADTSAITHLNQYLKNPKNTAYEEDFSLLKAALQQYNGQPVNGKASLEFLSRSSSTGTGYYLDIVGMWLLEHKLYAAAVPYFAEASKNGYPEAPLHEAWAQAMSGNKEAAREAATLATTIQNPETVREAQHMLQLLNLTPEQLNTLKTSEEKLQFLAFQTVQNPTEFSGLINTIPEPDLKYEAQNLLAEKLIARNMVEAAQANITVYGGDIKTKTPQQAETNRLQALIWAKTNNITALKNNLANFYFEPEQQHEKQFYQAIIAVAENRMPEAKKLFDRVIKTMPYSEDALMAAANFYRDQQKNDFKAYDILLTGISYNPFSAALYNAYAFQSIRAGFESYAQTAAEKLRTLISEEEYLTFNRLYQARLAAHKQLAEGWE